MSGSPPPFDGAPLPTEEELAAILAAYEVLWPKPVVVAPGAGGAGRPDSRWRFSGRWWSKPVALRRERPATR